jgi:hypothetical protein
MLVLGTATACCALLAGTLCCHIVENEEMEGTKNTKIVIVKKKKISGNKLRSFLAQSYIISISECPMKHDLF